MTGPARVVLVVLVALGLGPGCGDDGPSNTVDAAGGSGGEPGLTPAAASIELAVRGGRTVVTGVLAGPSPAAYEVEAASDRCQVRRLVASSCPVPCGFGEACVGDQCVPPPPLRSAGTLVLTGGGQVRQVAFGPGGYVVLEDGEVWPTGTAVSIYAPGGEVGGFAGEVTMVAPLAGVTPAQPMPTAGQPLVLTWSAPDPAARVRLTLISELQHGAPAPVLVDCDVADVGRLEVPVAAVDAITEPGIWGCGRCPVSTLVRYRRAEVVASDLGPVELRAVGAGVEFIAR